MSGVEPSAALHVVVRGYAGRTRPGVGARSGSARAFGDQRALQLSRLDLPKPPEGGGILEVHVIRLDRTPDGGPFIAMWIDARGAAGGGYLIPTTPIRGAMKSVARDDLQVCPGVVAGGGFETDLVLLNPIDVPTTARLELSSPDGLSDASSPFEIGPWSAWRGELSRVIRKAPRLLEPHGNVGALVIKTSHKVLPKQSVPVLLEGQFRRLTMRLRSRFGQAFGLRTRAVPVAFGSTSTAVPSADWIEFSICPVCRRRKRCMTSSSVTLTAKAASWRRAPVVTTSFTGDVLLPLGSTTSTPVGGTLRDVRSVPVRRPSSLTSRPSTAVPAPFDRARVCWMPEPDWATLPPPSWRGGSRRLPWSDRATGRRGCVQAELRRTTCHWNNSSSRRPST